MGSNVGVLAERAPFHTPLPTNGERAKTVLILAPVVASVPSHLTEGLFFVGQSGDPSGNRTRVTGVRGRCPNR